MIGFMGKAFDHPEDNIAGDKEFWKLCLRAVKPGGHLLAFGSTRTYHRMAVAIEDAGFEVRDMLNWCYASGFPKSQNISKQMSKSKNIPLCTCKEHEPMIELGYENNTTNNQEIRDNDGLGSGEEVGSKRNDNNEVEKQAGYTDIPFKVSNETGSDVQSLWQENNEATKGHKEVAESILREGMCGSVSEKEGYGSVAIREGLETDKRESESKGQSLSGMRESGSATSPSSCSVQNGGQECNGEFSRSMQELPQQSGETNRKGNRQGSNESKNNKWGIDNKFICSKCGNLRKDLGGTAIKPAHEPIIMARKPLSEKTIVEQVLKTGTGAIDIDGCRIPTSDTNAGWNGLGGGKGEIFGEYNGQDGEQRDVQGRFPANIICTDDALNDGVMTKSGNMNGVYKNTLMANKAGTRDGKEIHLQQVGDSGSKSRFFDIDCWGEKHGLLQFPKASRRERFTYLHCNCKTVKLEAWQKQDQNLNEKTDGTSPEVDTSEKQSTDGSLFSMSITGNENMGQSQKDIPSTTSITINKTIDSKTYNSLTQQNTSDYTQDAKSETENGGSPAQSAKNTNPSTPDTGISHQKDGHYTGVAVPATSAGLYMKSVCVDCGSEVRSDGHPTQKPVHLMSWLVRLVSKEEDTVLDPFAGSFTTGVACKMLGRNFIGIEMDADYCTIGKARIDAVKPPQPKLIP